MGSVNYTYNNDWGFIIISESLLYTTLGVEPTFSQS